MSASSSIASMLRISFACRSVYMIRPLLARLHFHQVLAAVERDLADARLALHALADDGERVACATGPSGAR